MLSSRSLLVYASCCLDFRDLYLFNHELKINAFHCYIWILHWQPNRVGPPWLSSKFYSDLIRSKTCVTPNSPCSITSQFWLNLDFTPFGFFLLEAWIDWPWPAGQFWPAPSEPPPPGPEDFHKRNSGFWTGKTPSPWVKFRGTNFIN